MPKTNLEFDHLRAAVKAEMQAVDGLRGRLVQGLKLNEQAFVAMIEAKGRLEVLVGEPVLRCR